MGLFDFFRRPTIERTSPFHAGDLGLLDWSDDNDAWRGTFHAQPFVIFPTPPALVPDGVVLAYAQSILKDLPWLHAAVAQEKEKYIACHPKFKTELQPLGIGSLAFSVHKRKGCYLNCQLGFSTPDRFWTLDFHGRNCTGMGFDT